MNKQDNDRMYATLTQNRRDMEAMVAKWSDEYNKQNKHEQILIKVVMFFCIIALTVGTAAVSVELYLKLKNNGSRTINAIELNGGRK